MKHINKTKDLSGRLMDYYGNVIRNLHFNTQHDEIYYALYYVLSMKGKRVRPLLLLHANYLFGGNIEEALPAALAVEMFHNYSLVHDDIMDNAPLRRGMPTVHEKYGLGTAINTGDLLMIIAYQYLTQVKAGYLREVLNLYNDTSTKIMKGQYFDLEFEGQGVVNAEAYIKMIEMKTALLFAFCMKLGALLAGASQEDQNLMFQVGRNLGVCFQIKDDWLDVYGDQRTGKMKGGDIVQNKKTFLQVKAWQLANKEQKRELTSLKTVENDDEKIKETLKIYTDLHLDTYTEKLIETYYLEAMDRLGQIKVREENKYPMYDIVKSIYLRKF